MIEFLTSRYIENWIKVSFIKLTGNFVERLGDQNLKLTKISTSSQL